MSEQSTAGERVEIDTEQMPGREAALLAKTILIPRPIAWVGSVSADGVPNLAPHSFFSMASETPPTMLFTSVGRKDSLTNIEATGEFTISIVTSATAQAANRTSAPYGPEVDEFQAAGLTARPSATVEAPSVAQSPAVLECTLEQVVPVGNSFVVIGRLRHVSLDPTVLREDSHGRRMPDAELLDPVTRLGRNEWARLGEVFTLQRPTSA